MDGSPAKAVREIDSLDERGPLPAEDDRMFSGYLYEAALIYGLVFTSVGFVLGMFYNNRKVFRIFHQVFQTDRDADQAVTDTGISALLRGQAAMGSGRRMGNGGLGITQVGGDGDHPRGIDKAPGALFATLDLEADHGTEGTLLTLGQFMLRMAGQACVIHALNAWLLLQP